MHTRFLVRIKQEDSIGMIQIFTFQGEIPPKKNKYRVGKGGRFYKPSDVNDFATQVGWGLKAQKAKLMKGKVRVFVQIFMKRDRDIDNCLGAVFDAIQEGGLIENDKMIVAVEAEKHKVASGIPPHWLLSVDDGQASG